ncbi:MAG: PD-(D/E)XK nuclease family protein [Candidatus Aenigmarchaeota archaeon]|nr:PD-(D/E)XK nuclease family protein [Candidatus Aenigmarchaeota archaeon]
MVINIIDFNKMIDNHLKRENRPKGIGRYYPSEIGTCLRKIWYSYKFPQDIQPELLKVFEVGNIMHDFVVKVLKSEKNPEVELLKSEFPFQHQLNDFIISGRIDNLILVKMANKSVLVEVKSTGNVDMVTKPAPHNAMQLQLYMHLLDIHDGILLYVDKRNLKSKVYTVPYNEEEAKKILERFQALHDHLKEDKLPDPESRADQEKLWMCRLCEYREKCYKETVRSAKWM